MNKSIADRLNNPDLREISDSRALSQILNASIRGFAFAWRTARRSSPDLPPIPLHGATRLQPVTEPGGSLVRLTILLFHCESQRLGAAANDHLTVEFNSTRGVF